MAEKLIIKTKILVNLSFFTNFLLRGLLHGSVLVGISVDGNSEDDHFGSLLRSKQLNFYFLEDCGCRVGNQNECFGSLVALP